MILIHNFTPQKYTMAGSSQFVPSLNAITTNQDLQWLVQPSLMHPPGPSRSPAPPYPAVAGSRPLGPTLSHSHLLRPGVIRASAATAAASTRRRNDEHVSRTFLKSLSCFQKIISVFDLVTYCICIWNNFTFKRAILRRCFPHGISRCGQWMTACTVCNILLCPMTQLHDNRPTNHVKSWQKICLFIQRLV